jgi:periplasmic copper chaperone A
MKQITRIFAISLALVAPVAGLAGSDDIVVEKPWARASIGTARPGVTYLNLRNTGDEVVTLTGLRTEVAIRPEIHRTATDAQGVSSMTPAGKIEIAPGTEVALEPGGLHAMLMMLQRPLEKGTTYPLTLLFDDGGKITVDVPVLGVATRGLEG